MSDELRGRKILVTGGAGFIGCNLCERFLEFGSIVVCLDNFITGRRENISHLLENENFTLIEGDITDYSTCEKAVSGCDYVSHQAALGSIPRSIDNPRKTNDINVGGTLNIFVAAQKEGVKRVIYASSSSVYGDDKNLPKEEDKTGSPLSPYAITKSVNEMYATVFSKIHAFPIIGLRYFNVFGRRQDPEGVYAAVIPKFVENLINNESPIIHGDGEQTRDFTFIENVIQMNIKSLLTDNSECFGECFNVACGTRMSINELFSEIKQLLSDYDSAIIDVEPKYVESRAGDIKHSIADISKAKAMIGYEPTYDCKEGLKEAIDWYWNELS
jgi:UDP-N-acetylglucosamine 4-epimerase